MGVACEIVRLPEELVSAALARTSPRDAYRAAVVSPAFRAATDSDDVWPSFLPPDGLPPLAAGPRPALIQEGALPSPLHRPMVVSMEATAEFSFC
ncbi:hypothetical protein ZWY2020_058854 [Hordeum vulgare]|nr:hypothetical protein ZWY2020_058854 [Hordeum vulgare]